MNVLGVSAYYHDSAACLVQDGRIVAAAQEERFTRKKHDEGFPSNAVAYCLRAGGVGVDGIDVISFYEKPLTKFLRIATTYGTIAPRGFAAFRRAMPTWMLKKLWIPYEIEREIRLLGYRSPKRFVFPEHHQSHAASAFYPSPFDSAAILTMDGVGEWACATVGVGHGAQVDLLREQRFPHSLGLLYSAFTYLAGFKVNSGEYKLMGLAPYGEPRFVKTILDNVIDLREDGSFRLNMRYFNFLGGLTMTSDRFADLFGGPARKPESEITKRDMDLARSIQVVTEEVVLRMARYARAVTGERNVCLAGGVALNCVANGALLQSGIFERIWIQPASGDAGGALGAALAGWYGTGDRTRVPLPSDSMNGSYLGPSFGVSEIRAFLDEHGYAYDHIPDLAQRTERVSRLVAAEKVIGLFQGRMEFGPRALGHRSIIGDARSPKMQSVMNLKTKFRESFRPFAPSVLDERAHDYFELDVESPYMMLVAPVAESKRKNVGTSRTRDLREWVNEVRSSVPAITHVDYSARVQTVNSERSPLYYALIKAFEDLTGEGLIINTSFNVRGEPIVCTPEDAYRCFMRCEMDYLLLEEFLLEKKRQPPFPDVPNWKTSMELD